MLFERIYCTEEEILDVAKKAEGKAVGTYDLYNRLDSKGNKGNIGQIIQEGLFGLPLDNKAEADFRPIDIELKVTGLKKNKRQNTYAAKERLVLSKISYMEEYKLAFEESSFWKKNHKLAILFYAWSNEKPKSKFRIIKTLIHEFDQADMIIIRRDWSIIMSKIKAGLAHEISERDTMYLGACTKGKDSSELVKQPMSNILAKPRAYSLKASYVTAFAKKYLNNDDVITLFSTDELERFSIEELIINRFTPYYGIDVDNILGDEYIRISDKALYYRVASKIMGLDDANLMNTDEFLKANIRLKTIRLEPNGNIEQSMSFENIDFHRWVINDWEESQIYECFSSTKFLFVIYQYKETKKQNPNRIAYLKAVKFWCMPIDVLEGPIKDMWAYTKDVLTKGVKLELRNGQVYNNLPGQSFNHICHIRPKGINSEDKYKVQLPDGQMITKQTYWLDRKYILKIIK